MHSRYFYPWMALALILTPLPVRAEISDLTQALALAYRHDPGLAAQQAKLRATDEQVSQALSNYRPSIDATGEAGRLREHVAGNGFFSGDNSLTPRDAGVTVTQPVFRGFRTSGAVRSAKAAAKAGQAELEDAEQQLMFTTARAYLDVLQAQQLVGINRQNQEALLQQLDITHERLRVGELTKTDASLTASRLQIAKVGLLQAQADLANKRLAFFRLVGEMPGTLKPPALNWPEPKSLDAAQTQAQLRNPGIVAADYAHRAAHADVTVAEGALLPEVSLVGNAQTAKDQDVTIPQRQDTYSIIAKVTIPLYRSGADYSKTRAAKQTEAQRGLEYDDTSNKIREATGEAWQTLATMRQVIKEDKAALDVTDKALYGVRQEALYGTRTTIDILNTQQTVFEAQSNLARAQHDEAIALLQLRQAMGELTARALKLPVTLYDPERYYDEARGRWVGWDIN